MQEGLFVNPKGNEIIKKDNNLIEAKYRLTVHEQRLVLTVLSAITINDDDFSTYTISLFQVAEEFGISKSKSFYSEIHEACKTLLGRRIDISEGKRRIYVNWLSYVEYIEGKGEVKIRFDAALKPYLLQLKGHFTEYQKSAVTRFRSMYSIRFYELLKMYQNLGNGGEFYRTFTINEIRGYMQIGDEEYTRYFNLKNKVINPSLKEINDHSDITIIRIEEIKKGRSIHAITITAEPKRQMVMDIREDIPEQENEGEKNATSSAIKILRDFGVGEDTAIKWAEKFGLERVSRNVAYTILMKKSVEIKNLVGYLGKCIDVDAGKGWEEEQQKNDEAKKTTKKMKKEKESELEKVSESQKMENIAMLEAFRQLSETNQDAMRDVFLSKQGEALKSIWRAELKKGNKPEERAMFRHNFVLFLKEEDVL
jgi:plasmid replication initiation protein